MFVTSINIAREGYYGNGIGHANPNKPLIAKIGIQGASGEMVLNLSAETSGRVLSLIADEVAAAGRAAAEMMTAEVFNAAALPAPTAPVAAELDMPF